MARAGGVLEPLNHRNHSFFSYIECYQPIKITLLPLQGHSPTEAHSGWPVCRPHAEGSGCATWTQSPESSGDWSSPQSPESSGDWPLSPIGRDFGQSNRYPQSAEMSADQHPTPQRHALADPPWVKVLPAPHRHRRVVWARAFTTYGRRWAVVVVLCLAGSPCPVGAGLSIAAVREQPPQTSPWKMGDPA